MDPELLPDGELVAADRYVQGNRSAWIIDAARGVPSQLTLDTAMEVYPRWSHDGKWIVFSSFRNSKY